MRHARWLTAVLVLAGAIALPATAGGNDWGTWMFSGHGKSWSGTFFDSHRVTGFVMGLTSLVKYNSVTSFTIGGKTCKLGASHGTGYCYYVHIPANKKLNWTLTTRRPAASSAALVPCIMFNGKFHCRYGNG